MAQKTKKNNFMITSAVVIILLLMVSMFGYLVIRDQRQATAIAEAEEEAIVGVSELLRGKPVTLSVLSNDMAAASPESTQANTKLYLLRGDTEADLVVTDTKISGEDFASDGGNLKTDDALEITKKITVGDYVIGLAANNTYYGIPSEIKELKDQGEGMDLDSWRITSGGDIELREVGESTSLLKGTKNVTLTTSKIVSFEYMKIYQNISNRALWVGGVYLNFVDQTNVSNFECVGATSDSSRNELEGVGYSMSSGLLRTTNDDYFVEFNKPIMLLGYEYIKMPGCKITADTSGTGTGEDFTVYVVDVNWFRSVKETALMLGFEDDSPDHADVGRSDISETYSLD